MIDNKHMSVFIAPGKIAKTAGTWTPAIAANVASDARGAAAAAFTLLVPIEVPANANYHNGARLKSIDVFYKIATADGTGFTLALNKIALPATGSAPTGSAVTQTQNSAEDTEAKRFAIGDHTLTVTITTPEWVSNASAYVLSLVVTAAAGTIFTLYGARANFDLRVD